MGEAIRRRLTPEGGWSACETCLKAQGRRPTDAAAPARRSPRLRQAGQGRDLDRLDTRSMEITLCMLCGDSNRQIAQRLGVSLSTVKRHLKALAHGGPPPDFRTRLRGRKAVKSA